MLAAALAASAPLAAQGTIHVRAGSVSAATYAPNTTVAVPIIIDMSDAAGANLASLTTQLKWGATRLTFDSVKAGNFGSLTANAADAANGNLTLSIFNATGTTTTVTMATVYFTSTPGATTVEVRPTAAGNETAANIMSLVRVRWLDACIAQGGYWGDVNADNTVNIVDAQQLARSSVGLSVANPAALATNGDVTADGTINIVDAQQIARFSVGLSASPRTNTLLSTPATVATLTVPHSYAATLGSFDPANEVFRTHVPLQPEAQLRPLAKDAGGADVTACASLTYASIRPAVLTVSSSGLVTGLVPDTASITVYSASGGVVTIPFKVDGNVAIATSVNPSGAGTTLGGGTSVQTSTATTVQVTANAGWKFSNWMENGTVVSTDSQYTFNVTRARTLVANFATTSLRGVIAVSANPSGGGAVYGASTYDVGTKISVATAPNSGYNFLNWTENGVIVHPFTDYPFAVTGNRTLVANFELSPLHVAIGVPPAYAYAGDSYSLNVSAASNTTITSMSVTVGGRPVTITRNSPTSTTWTGTMDLTGLSRDTLFVVATAVDANGVTASATKPIIHDALPSVSVSSPTEASAAIGTLNYAATCGDDDPAGCASLTVSITGGPMLATGTSSVSGSTSVSSYTGQTIEIVFKGTDSQGRSTTIKRAVYVSSSAHFTLLGTAPGNVDDASGDRAIYRRPSDGGQPLALWNLSSSASTTIPLPTGLTGTTRLVTPLGAILGAGVAGSVNYSLYDYRSGSLYTTTNLESWGNIVVNGNYAAFTTSPAPGLFDLYRRDLISGSDILVTSWANNTNNDVAPDGSIAYMGRGDMDVYWYHAGAVQRLTNDDNATWWNVDPRTDGTNVVFTRRTPSTGGTRTYYTVLHDGTTETTLATYVYSNLGDPAYSYELNNGWTAFLKPDGSNIRQVWLRAPSGTLRQVSSLTSSASIDAIGSDGTTVFRAGGRTYIATATGAPVDVNGGGRVVWRNTEFLVILGSSVLRLTP